LRLGGIFERRLVIEDETIAPMNSRAFDPTVAFLLAPLAPGCLVIIFLFNGWIMGNLFLAVEGHHLELLGLKVFGFLLLILIVSALIAYPPALLVGIPAYVLFKRLEWNAAPVYISFGIGVGALYSVVFTPALAFIIAQRVAPLSLHVGLILPCAFYGGLVALFFWLMARPDLPSDRMRTPPA